MTLAPFLIPRLFSAFSSLHPGIHLDLMEGSIHDITAFLRTGRCEVAIVYDFGLGEEFPARPPLCRGAPCGAEP